MKTLLSLFLLLVFASIPALADGCLGCDVTFSCYGCHNPDNWPQGWDSASNICIECGTGGLAAVKRIPRDPEPQRAVHGISGRGQDLIAVAEGYIQGLLPTFSAKAPAALTLERITRFGQSAEHRSLVDAARLRSRRTATCSTRLAVRYPR